MYLLGFIGPQELIIILMIVPLFMVLPLVALISVLTNRFEGNDKLIWVLVILLLPIIGAILYFAIGRSKRIKESSSSPK
jgi:uncharacterized membrane protein YhaH (DUF805 family)